MNIGPALRIISFSKPSRLLFLNRVPRFYEALFSCYANSRVKPSQSGLNGLNPLSPQPECVNFCKSKTADDDVDRFDLHHFFGHPALQILC